MSLNQNEELRRREASGASGVYPMKDVALVRGEGAYVWDAEGKRYIDCSAGHGVAALGHAHPKLVQAVTRQVSRLTTCAGSFPNDQRADLQERLCALLPDGFERVFLCNSGSEAVEGALKFARRSTGRSGFVAAERGFHGRTMGALACTWEEKYRGPFEPLIGEVSHAPFNDLAGFEARVDDDTAAVLVEVVQGEGGVRPADAEFLRGLRKLCDERGALLIFDEVQTGFGRTGRAFAFEHFDVEPDLISLGKGIAGGLAMGAVGIGAGVGALQVGDHGSTFGGNPLACAAANATLEAMVEEGLFERSTQLGARFADSLRALTAEQIVEVRGLGLMVAMELNVQVAPLLKALLDVGVIALPAGPQVIRFLPPLVIQEEALTRVAELVGAVLDAARAPKVEASE